MLKRTTRSARQLLLSECVREESALAYKQHTGKMASLHMRSSHYKNSYPQRIPPPPGKLDPTPFEVINPTLFTHIDVAYRH